MREKMAKNGAARVVHTEPAYTLVFVCCDPQSWAPTLRRRIRRRGVQQQLLVQDVVQGSSVGALRHEVEDAGAKDNDGVDMMVVKLELERYNAVLLSRGRGKQTSG